MFVRHLYFGVTHGFGESATDEHVFLRAAAPLVRLACSGGVAALFMFGQTGSGKTHTMSASPLRQPSPAKPFRLGPSGLGPLGRRFCCAGWNALCQNSTPVSVTCAAAIESRAAAMFFGAGVAGGRGAVPKVEALRVEFLELVGKRSLDLLSPSKAEVTVKARGSLSLSQCRHVA